MAISVEVYGRFNRTLTAYNPKPRDMLGRPNVEFEKCLHRSLRNVFDSLPSAYCHHKHYEDMIIIG